MKKNKKNKHQEVRTDFCQPYSVSHQETKAPEEKGVVYWLKKIFTVQGITTIIAVVSLSYVIYDHLPKDEKTELKEIIANKIPEVKKQLDSNIIPHELDTIAEVKVMQEFIRSANGFATVTQNILETTSRESDNYESSVLYGVVMSYKDQTSMYFDYYKKFSTMVVMMVALTGAEKVNAVVDHELVTKLTNQADLADQAAQKHYEEATLAAQNKDNKKVLEQVKEAHTNIEYLRFMNMSLDYVLQVNRLIEIRVAELKKEHNL